jgi:hypothetical protein
MPSSCQPLHLLARCALLVALAGNALAEETPAPTAAQPASTLRPPLPARSESMASDLRRAIPGDEQVILKSGKERVLGLWHPANHGTPKGVVILLPGDGESADWPRAIGPLRRGLPDHGWHTLSLTLPDPERPIRVIEQAPAVEEPAQEPDASEPPEELDDPQDEPPAEDSAAIETPYLPEQAAVAPEESDSEEPEPTPPAEDVDEEIEVFDLAGRIDQRIDAALELARDRQAATIVLLGHGSGAYWAARYIQLQQPGDVSHLLAIQPRQPADAELTLERLLPELGIATGDFYYKDGPASAAQARQRMNASRRLAHPDYSQTGLQPLSGDRQAEQQQLLRRVRGWLDRQY